MLINLEGDGISIRWNFHRKTLKWIIWELIFRKKKINKCVGLNWLIRTQIIFLGCSLDTAATSSLLATGKSCKTDHDWKGQLKLDLCVQVCQTSPMLVFGRKGTSKCTSDRCNCYCIKPSGVVDGKCVGEYTNPAFDIYTGICICGYINIRHMRHVRLFELCEVIGYYLPRTINIVLGILNSF